jgi:hypothetical protein
MGRTWTREIPVVQLVSQRLLVDLPGFPSGEVEIQLEVVADRAEEQADGRRVLVPAGQPGPWHVVVVLDEERGFELDLTLRLDPGEPRDDDPPVDPSKLADANVVADVDRERSEDEPPPEVDPLHGVDADVAPEV